MAQRQPTNPKIDHKVFSNTAITNKKVNLNPTISRGGIRF